MIGRRSNDSLQTTRFLRFMRVRKVDMLDGRPKVTVGRYRTRGSKITASSMSLCVFCGLALLGLVALPLSRSKRFLGKETLTTPRSSPTQLSTKTHPQQPKPSSVSRPSHPTAHSPIQHLFLHLASFYSFDSRPPSQSPRAHLQSMLISRNATSRAASTPPSIVRQLTPGPQSISPYTRRSS
jgi:hypothetical protein